MNKIIIKELTIKYKDKLIFKDAECFINSGDVVLIEGGNGSGKTTFFKAIIGLDKSSKNISGDVFLPGFEKNVLNMNNTELLDVKSTIAYLDQKDEYDSNPFTTVMDVLLDSYKDFKKIRKVSKEDKNIIEQIFNKHIPKSRKFNLKSKVSKLSGGQQRLVSILAQICIRKEADVFVIDEPLNNLDINTVVNVSNIINSIIQSNKNAIFLISSHWRVFPFITRVLEIRDMEFHESLHTERQPWFGKLSEDGYYN